MGNSPRVVSDQKVPHEKLLELVRKHRDTPYLRPIAHHTQTAFDHAWQITQQKGYTTLVLDTGCGTGESTLHLAQLYPQSMVWGIDKSEHRLAKVTATSLPNAIYVRADLVDLWLLVHQAQITVVHQAVFYPNPWPKSKHLMRRWHAHPIWSTIMSLGGTLEIRTNWQIYAQEAMLALGESGKFAKLEEFVPLEFWTAFERKYAESQHSLYQIRVM